MAALTGCYKKKISENKKGAAGLALAKDSKGLGAVPPRVILHHFAHPKHIPNITQHQHISSCDSIEDSSERRRRMREEESKRETRGFRFSTSSNGLYYFPFPIFTFNRLYE
ncbi:hypothetical protein ACOSQ3_024394 [Xanthoceras sorbifolium]